MKRTEENSTLLDLYIYTRKRNATETERTTETVTLLLQLVSSIFALCFSLSIGFWIDCVEPTRDIRIQSASPRIFHASFHVAIHGNMTNIDSYWEATVACDWRIPKDNQKISWIRSIMISFGFFIFDAHDVTAMLKVFSGYVIYSCFLGYIRGLSCLFSRLTSRNSDWFAFRLKIWAII